MAFLLIAFLVVALIPLFAASSGMSLLSLCAQGLLLGWIAWRAAHGEVSVSLLVTLADFVLIRAFLAPRALSSVLAAQKAARRKHVIPSNLFSWALVGGLVFVSFGFGTASKTNSRDALHLATATAALLLGMYVLSSQSAMFSQMVGLLRIDNAISLYELMSTHHQPIPIQAGVSLVYLLTILYLSRFLRAELQYASHPPAEEEAPTL